MNFDIVVFGRRLKALRKSHRLSQVQLAMILNISTQHLSNIENGRRRPSIELIINIAQYFRVSLDFLILGTEGSANVFSDICAEFSLGLAHLKMVQNLLNALK